MKNQGGCNPALLLAVLFLLVFPTLPLYSSKAASPATFAIGYDPRPHVYLYPLENELDRNVTVENTSDANLTLEFNATIYGPNGFVKTGDMLGIAPLPQPNYLYLQPSGSNKIYIVIGWGGDIDTSHWQSGANYTYTIELSVYPVANPSLKQTVNLTNIVDVLPVAHPGSISGFGLPSNASVSGRVLAADTGQPISEANVTVSALQGVALFQSSTDPSGNYEVSIVAYRRVEQGNYLDYDVRITASGYQAVNRFVTPTPGQNIVLNAVLPKVNQTAHYAVFAQFDTHMNNGAGAASADGKIFAIRIFHTINVNSDYIYQNSYIWTFDSNGTLLWKFKVYSQSPALDVSANGSMVATSVTVEHPVGGGSAPQPPIPPGVYLFDSNGNVVWTYTSDQYLAIDSVYDVKFSHSGRYLAAGDTQGNVVMIDLTTKTVMWHSFLDGQLRDILFNQNDSAAYFSSGDGYLYALSTQNGNRLWRAFVGAWGLSMAISKDYLLVSGKNGYYLHLVDSAGKTLWTAPAYHAGFDLIISPDQSFMIYYGNAAETSTTVFASNGTREFSLDPSNGGALSSDQRYFTETGMYYNGPSSAVTYVSLFTRSGYRLWTATLNSSSQHATGSGYQWISPDKTEIIATTGEYVYFLRGSITNITGSTTTSTVTTSTTSQSSTSTTASATITTSTITTTATAISASNSTTAPVPEFPNVGSALVLSVTIVVATFLVLMSRKRRSFDRSHSRFA